MGTIFDKVGVPFDGSAAAGLAIQSIGPVLAAVDGSVHVILVLDQYVQNELTEFAQAEGLTIGRAAEVSCERLIAEITGSGIDATHVIVDSDDVVDGVGSAAEAAGCTALALPTHGFKGVTRWLMGNLRDKIVSRVPLPILVMPPTG